MRIDISLPDHPPDFRLTPAQFATAERQATINTLKAARTQARAEYKRQAPELRKRFINKRVVDYRRKLWIGLDPINVAGLEESKILPPPSPGPGGFGIDEYPGVFLIPRRPRGYAFRRYLPYPKGQGRSNASIVPVESDVPPHAGRRAADVAYEFMQDYYLVELGRQIDRRLST